MIRTYNQSTHYYVTSVHMNASMHMVCALLCCAVLCYPHIYGISFFSETNCFFATLSDRLALFALKISSVVVFFPPSLLLLYSCFSDTMGADVRRSSNTNKSVITQKCKFEHFPGFRRHSPNSNKKKYISNKWRQRDHSAMKN